LRRPQKGAVWKAKKFESHNITCFPPWCTASVARSGGLSPCGRGDPVCCCVARRFAGITILKRALIRAPRKAERARPVGSLVCGGVLAAHAKNQWVRPPRHCQSARRARMRRDACFACWSADQSRAVPDCYPLNTKGVWVTAGIVNVVVGTKCKRRCSRGCNRNPVGVGACLTADGSVWPALRSRFCHLHR